MNRLYAGLVAGAAGTVALDVSTYADMVIRGRSPSDMPSELVRTIAAALGVTPLAKSAGEASDAMKNRRAGLGAMAGYVVGLGVGATYGLAQPLVSRMPFAVKAAAAGAAAMAASDVPLTMLQLTDPKTWGTSGWLADIIPHAIYGIVVAGVIELIVSSDE